MLPRLNIIASHLNFYTPHQNRTLGRGCVRASCRGRYMLSSHTGLSQPKRGPLKAAGTPVRMKLKSVALIILPRARWHVGALLILAGSYRGRETAHHRAHTCPPSHTLGGIAWWHIIGRWPETWVEHARGGIIRTRNPWGNTATSELLYHEPRSF